MAESSQQESLLALFAQTRDVVDGFITSRSDAERSAIGRSDPWSAPELLTAIAFWMDYTVDRMEYYVRGEPAPREVDFGAVEEHALVEHAHATWEQRVAAFERALDGLMAEVRRFSDADLNQHNSYGEDPGGPLLGEIQANGFIWPLQEVEKYLRRVGDETRADEMRRLLVPVVGEEEPPIACDLTTPDTLRPMREQGRVVVLDVRDASEFARGHVAGARHIPLDELPSALASLPADQPIVTYCNMHHPGHSRGERAAALLAAHGLRASAIAGGFPAYTASGQPVEREPQRDG